MRPEAARTAIINGAVAQLTRRKDPACGSRQRAFPFRSSCSSPGAWWQDAEAASRARSAARPAVEPAALVGGRTHDALPDQVVVGPGDEHRPRDGAHRADMVIRED